MSSLESFVTLMVGAMSIPALALLLIACCTTQIAPARMQR